MSDSTNVPEGQDYVVDIRPSNPDDVMVCIDGKACLDAHIDDLTGGGMRVTVPASVMVAPGTLEIKEGQTVIHCANIVAASWTGA